MEKEENKKYRFGLVGKNISYSFSKGYFGKKFSDLELQNHSYENFDLENISDLPAILKEDNDIKGLNVTIPYKQKIIPYLDELDTNAEIIGAVNTIRFTSRGLKGYNTDAYGFQKAIKPYLKKEDTKALILGTGGASKAIAFVFNKLDIKHTYVSRHPKKNQYSYLDLDQKILDEYSVIINCTPLGTYPNIKQKPNIPYQYITTKHLLFDLIYNPEKTAFLIAGEKKGAAISNGHKMLVFQAEKAWQIWNS